MMPSRSTLVVVVCAALAHGLRVDPRLPDRPFSRGRAAPTLKSRRFTTPTEDRVGSRATSEEAFRPAAAVTTTALLVALATPTAAVAAAPEWVAPVSAVLDPALFIAQFAMLCRVLLSWYPEVNLNKLPYNLVAWPTEPLLRATRAIVPPAFGVDVSPIVWIAIASLARELLLGQQGILVLMATK